MSYFPSLCFGNVLKSLPYKLTPKNFKRTASAFPPNFQKKSNSKLSPIHQRLLVLLYKTLPRCSPPISYNSLSRSTSISSKPPGNNLLAMSHIKSQSILPSASRSDLIGGQLPRSCGEIHVIVGPMFAGKTTALLRRVKSEGTNGRNVAMIKSSKDNRYAIDSVVTHDGTKFPCWALPDLLSFKHKFGLEAYEKLEVIGIDEAQFFDDLYDFCCMAADHDGKTVVVAGLDGDYLRRNFGSVLDIIPIADTITKLTARCELCGKRAFFTLRKTDDKTTELIGGADMYMPVCRQHYVTGQSVIKAARHVLESHKVHGDRNVVAAV